MAAAAATPLARGRSTRVPPSRITRRVASRTVSSKLVIVVGPPFVDGRALGTVGRASRPVRSPACGRHRVVRARPDRPVRSRRARARALTPRAEAARGRPAARRSAPADRRCRPRARRLGRQAVASPRARQRGSRDVGRRPLARSRSATRGCCHAPDRCESTRSLAQRLRGQVRDRLRIARPPRKERADRPDVRAVDHFEGLVFPWAQTRLPLDLRGAHTR